MRAFLDPNVGRLDIAVDNPFRVSGRQALRDLLGIVDDFLIAQPLVVFVQRFQRGAFEHLHGHVGDAGFFSHFEDCRHVVVVNRGHRARFS